MDGLTQTIDRALARRNRSDMVTWIIRLVIVVVLVAGAAGQGVYIEIEIGGPHERVD